MIELTLAEIASITGGHLDEVTDPQARVKGFVEFDSRKVTPGSLFVALPGAHVDGHDFAQKAVAQGAAAVLAARPVGVPAIVVKPTGRITGEGANADIYAHDSDGSAAAVVAALSSLARAVTARLEKEHGLTIVGVTGSAGKTSTKDLLATALRSGGETVAPPGSFNNEIGLPYTALRCDESTRFLVSEMSARGIGHIAHLAKITVPKIGIVLNVGSAHLGEFGSRSNIAAAKGELVEALPSAADGGVAVLNADDSAVAAMSQRTDARVITYSVAQPPAPGASLYATNIVLDDVARPSFTLHVEDDFLGHAQPVEVKLQVFGAHQVSNALATVAAALAAGVPLSAVTQALQGHTAASEHRMDVETRKDGLTVIDDAYNANPDSMRAAIAALGYTVSARPEARAIAVLGEMGELGPGSVQAHRAIVEDLCKYQIGYLIVVGQSPNCMALAETARAQGITTMKAASNEQAVACVKSIISAAPTGVEHWAKRHLKDVVLVKASNSQGLWQVAQSLKNTDILPLTGTFRKV